MKTTTSKSASREMMATLLATGAALAVLMHAPVAHADAALGKTQFAACAACHSTTGAEGVGPNLNGVIGRKAGTVPGFNFSPAMRRSGVTWDDQTLAAYITDPQKAVPGNRMPFSGMPDQKQVANIIDYLKTLH